MTSPDINYHVMEHKVNETGQHEEDLTLVESSISPSRVEVKINSLTFILCHALIFSTCLRYMHACVCIGKACWGGG